MPMQSLLCSVHIRENLLARQTLEQNLVHTGATDLDVAMFHRDGGTSRCSVGRTYSFVSQEWHICFISSSTLLSSLLLSPGEDSDSDSDLSMEEERSLSIPSSESEDNVRLRGRIQRRFKRSNHSERLLTEPAQNGTKGKLAPWKLWKGRSSSLTLGEGRRLTMEPFSQYWSPFKTLLYKM